MDPLHITEFASERYFSKLRQLDEHAESSTPPVGQTASTSTSTLLPATSGPGHHFAASTFTLPLHPARPRHSNDDAYLLKPSEQRKRSLGHDLTGLRAQRRPSLTGSFGTFRSRLVSSRNIPSLEQHREAFDDLPPPVAHIPRLNELFLALPSELQSQIIATLPIHDILNLRLVSRAYQALVCHNESPIARHHVTHSLPAFALRLYPLPAGTDLTLHYVCGIWHRLHVAAKLSKMIAEQATKDVFLRKTPVQRREFLPQHRRMQQRLMPLLFAIFHFFETYRDRHARHLMKGGVSLAMWPHTVNPIEREVMETYDDQTLLQVHQVFPLVMSCFSRRLRPPSYVGTVEKTLKGYLRDKPPDEVYATILAVGGLRQAQRFWETKGYNARRAAVDTWYGYVAKPSLEPATCKKKSIMSRVLKHSREQKKAVGPADAVAMDCNAPGHDVSGCQEWFCVKPSCSAGRADSADPLSQNGLFSSLTAGPPMRPLTADELQRLVPDLQPLTSIWCLTAEALILERKIVARPQDIKRNTQMLLELIKDDASCAMDDALHTHALERTSTLASVATGLSGGLSD